MKKNKVILSLAIASAVLFSCENQDVDFPDYDYQTVYFATPNPIRTVVLGEDLMVNNTLDNEHKIEIKATTGGAYGNKKTIQIGYIVDNSLCNNLYYIDGATSNQQVLPMPSSYYQLLSDKLTILPGDITGGVQVKLTDAYFEDPLSVSRTYVIPLLMNSVQGADTILQGQPLIENPDRMVNTHWSVKPLDYVLYAVQYVNSYHGNYLRRGADVVTIADGSQTNAIRRTQYVDDNEVVKVSTNALDKSTLALTLKDNANKDVKVNVVMTFAADQTCTLSSTDPAYDVTGTGKFVIKGEKNSFGGKDRNGLYLDYTVDLKALNRKYATKDTLVVRDRAVAPAYFDVVRK
jgi:hypothetical protein